MEDLIKKEEKRLDKLFQKDAINSSGFYELIVLSAISDKWSCQEDLLNLMIALSEVQAVITTQLIQEQL